MKQRKIHILMYSATIHTSFICPIWKSKAIITVVTADFLAAIRIVTDMWVLKMRQLIVCMYTILKLITFLKMCSPAEVASLLIRNVSYEGPALRKQLAKAQQLQQELSRREVECQSSAADLRERYYAACKQYGIRVSAGEHEVASWLSLCKYSSSGCWTSVSSLREKMCLGSFRLWSKIYQWFSRKLGRMPQS